MHSLWSCQNASCIVNANAEVILSGPIMDLGVEEEEDNEDMEAGEEDFVTLLYVEVIGSFCLHEVIDALLTWKTFFVSRLYVTPIFMV